MKYNIIVAVDNNFLIGNTDKMPWYIKEELKYFRKITAETEKTNYLICGYNTWQSLKGKKLKNRRLVVIDRDAIGVHYEEEQIRVKDFKMALHVCKVKEDCDKVFVIGGAKIYKIATSLDFLDKIDTLYLTLIKKKYEGNVYFDKKSMYKFVLDKAEKVKTEDGIILEYCQYKPKMIIFHEELQYLNLINNILENGQDCDDRTGVGIRSLFGTQMKFDLSKGFPLLTTKKMFTRGITEELLWFLRGETDAKILQEKKVRIWDGNSTREFLDNRGLTHLEEGDIGAAYGFQFRHFGAKYENCHADYTGRGFDQVEYVLDQIRNHPTSRRIVLSLWNPPDLNNAVLPPCHMVYQFRVYGDKLSCSMYQRSGDIGLGVPFNIASASLMTYLFAHLTGLKPGMLVHTIADAHIYNNHIDAMKKQIMRDPLPFPKLKIKDRGQSKVEDYLASDFEITGYISHPGIKMQMAV